MSGIQYGDHVIVYSSRETIDSITVCPEKHFQSKYGFFKHDEMLGVPFGSKFPSSNGKGFVYLLKPTPELWTLALPHRTQILYLPDIAFITSYLDIKPGSRVVEAGTGSGSFSHSVARNVGSKGRVYSFEFHEERFIKARDEFREHKLDGIIRIKHQNVYKDGFELLDEVDSVFLDLPAPWEAIGHAKIALRKDRQSRICCFSPCIEQVLRTVSSLAELGFSDITTYETLTRTHDLAPLIAPDVSSAIERIEAVEAKKGRRREGQIEDAKKRREERKRKREEEDGEGEEEREEGGKGKRVRGDGETEGEGEGEAADVEMSDVVREAEPSERGTATPTLDAPMPDVSNTTPVPTTTTPSLPSPLAIPSPPASASLPESKPKPTPATKPAPKVAAPRPERPPRQFTFKAGPQARGHTSYLTFGTLLPLRDVGALASSGERTPLESLPVPTAGSRGMDAEAGAGVDEAPLVPMVADA